MKTGKSVSVALVAGCLAVTPLLAQSADAPGSTTMGATTSVKTTVAVRSGKKSMKSRVLADATRLASLLRDVQTGAAVNAGAWATVSNEANSLANRLYGETSGNATARVAARNARMHVREFRKAARSGDAAGAREHASQAMPFVSQLIDWAS